MPQIKTLTVSVLTVMTFAVASTSLAQTQAERPLGPDVGGIATELNLSFVDVELCFPRPGSDQAPAAETPFTSADAEEISACFQAASPSLTTDQIDEVLRKHLPLPSDL